VGMSFAEHMPKMESPIPTTSCNCFPIRRRCRIVLPDEWLVRVASRVTEAYFQTSIWPSMHAHLQHKQRIHFLYNQEIQNFLSRKTSEKGRLQNAYRISYILCRELTQQTFYCKTGQLHRPSNESAVGVRDKESVLKFYSFL
jgi:hypothetical protein